jgi:hypothetical protein
MSEENPELARNLLPNTPPGQLAPCEVSSIIGRKDGKNYFPQNSAPESYAKSSTARTVVAFTNALALNQNYDVYFVGYDPFLKMSIAYLGYNPFAPAVFSWSSSPVGDDDE